MTQVLPLPPADLPFEAYVRACLKEVPSPVPAPDDEYWRPLRQANPVALRFVLTALGAPRSFILTLFEQEPDHTRQTESSLPKFALALWKESGRSITELLKGTDTLWPTESRASMARLALDEEELAAWTRDLSTDLGSFLSFIKTSHRAAQAGEFIRTPYSPLNHAVKHSTPVVKEQITHSFAETFVATAGEEDFFAIHIAEALVFMQKTYEVHIAPTLVSNTVKLLLQSPLLSTDTRDSMASRLLSLALDPSEIANRLAQGLPPKEQGPLVPHFSKEAITNLLDLPVLSVPLKVLKLATLNPHVQSDPLLAKKLLDPHTESSLARSLWKHASPIVQQWFVDSPRYENLVVQHMRDADRSVHIPPPLFARALAVASKEDRTILVSRLHQTRAPKPQSPTPPSQ